MSAVLGVPASDPLAVFDLLAAGDWRVAIVPLGGGLLRASAARAGVVIEATGVSLAELADGLVEAARTAARDRVRGRDR